MNILKRLYKNIFFTLQSLTCPECMFKILNYVFNRTNNTRCHRNIFQNNVNCPILVKLFKFQKRTSNLSSRFIVDINLATQTKNKAAFEYLLYMYFLCQERYPGLLDRARGLGTFCSVDFPGAASRDKAITKLREQGKTVILNDILVLTKLCL